MKNRILEAIKRGLALATVDEKISTENCDAWDSLRHLNVIVEVESEFNISIEPEEMPGLTSFEKIETLVLSKKDKPNLV